MTGFHQSEEELRDAAAEKERLRRAGAKPGPHPAVRIHVSRAMFWGWFWFIALCVGLVTVACDAIT